MKLSYARAVIYLVYNVGIVSLNSNYKILNT